MDLLLLSSIDLGYGRNQKKLIRQNDLEELVRLETSALALVTDTPLRSRDVSKEELNMESRSEGELPFIEVILDDSKQNFIQQIDDLFGTKRVFVYYISSLRSEFKVYEAFSKVEGK